MKRRYQNRESRPEDLEQIRYWKNIGSEQEAELSQLMVGNHHKPAQQLSCCGYVE